MTAPTWGDDPTPVLGMIKVLVEEQPHATAEPSAEAERRLLEHRLWVHLDGVRRCSARSRRPDRGCVSGGHALPRHPSAPDPAAHAAGGGRRLAGAGVLPEAEDVFHLNLEELEALPGRSPGRRRRRSDPHDSRDRAARRAELAGVPMLAASLVDPAATATDALVTGVPASGGRVTGPVRVIREPAEFGALRSGDVLVCPYTNPTWTSLFQRRPPWSSTPAGSARTPRSSRVSTASRR